MIYCPECGARISGSARTCPYCGYNAAIGGEIVPIGSLPPAHPATRVRMPELAIFDDGSDLVPQETNTKFAAFLKDAKEMARLAPGVYDAIQKCMAKRGTIWAADFTAAAEKLMESGELVLSVEKSTGEYLPQLRSVKTGRVYEKARLHAEQLPNELASSLASLQTQMMVAELMDEIKNVAVSVESLRLENRGDRMAMAQSVWLSLEQAMNIKDSRLREYQIMNIAQSATQQRCVFQENFKVQLQIASASGGKNKGKGQAAHDALIDLSVLSLMARSEYAAYAVVGAEEAAKTALEQFQGFVIENKLDERDTLLRINGKSNENLEGITDGFYTIARNVRSLQLKTPDEARFELLEEGDGDR